MESCSRLLEERGMGMWITKRRRSELSMHDSSPEHVLCLRSNYLSHNHFRDPRNHNLLPSRINVYPSSFRFYPPSFRPWSVFIPTICFYTLSTYTRIRIRCVLLLILLLLYIRHVSPPPVALTPPPPPRALSPSCYPCHRSFSLSA